MNESLGGKTGSGKMELCLQIVNARNIAVRSFVKIGPDFKLKTREKKPRRYEIDSKLSQSPHTLKE
jgi:hypothetical protein